MAALITTENSRLTPAFAAAGGRAKLARRLGVSRAVVSVWARRGWVPWRRALEIEEKLGVPRTQTMDPSMVVITA